MLSLPCSALMSDWLLGGLIAHRAVLSVWMVALTTSSVVNADRKLTTL